jgi:hypothetical protein
VISKFEGTVFQRKADGFAFFVSPMGKIWDIGEEMSKFWPDITQVLNVMGMARHIRDEVIDISFDNIWIFAIPDTMDHEIALNQLLEKCLSVGCSSLNLVGSEKLYELSNNITDVDVDLALCISD